MASGSSSFSGTSATVMGDDSSNPYFLYHEESLRMSLVKQPLTKENYHSWSRLMVIALAAKNKIGSVNGSITAPGISSPLTTLGRDVTQWFFYGCGIRCQNKFQPA